ncbi:surface-adhesin E family protein [Pseudoxanthomonas mexicana]
MRLSNTVFLLALLSIAGNGYAADWVYLISKKDFSADLTADRDSIRRSGDEARVWAKWTHKESYKDNIHSRPYRISMEHYAFKCFAREKALVSYILYADLEMTERNYYYKTPGELEWSDVIPETIHEALMNLACGAPDSTGGV